MNLIIIALFLGTPTVLENIFTPLSLEHISVAHDGTIFILDSSDYKIVRISSYGEKLHFSGRGQGPSEMSAPVSIAVDGDQLYVFDFIQNILVFDLSGVFKKTIKLPHEQVLPSRVSGGWVYTVDFLDKTRESILYFTDSNGIHSKELAKFKASPSTLFVKKSTQNSVSLDLNPAVDRVFWTQSLDKKNLYVYIPGDPLIKILEVPSCKEVGTFSLGHSPRRFDTAWGEKRIKTISENVTLNGARVTAFITPKFPKVFPLVRGMWAGPDGNIWISDERSLYDPNAPVKVFSPKGEVVNNVYDSKLSGHLVQVIGDKAFIVTFNSKTENPEIHVVQKEDINALLKTFANSISAFEEPGLRINQ